MSEAWLKQRESGIATLKQKRFKVGDHVSWNSEAGRVRGTIVKVVTSKIRFKGYRRHASKAEPQYQIKSDKTDFIAMHKGSALTKLSQSRAGSRKPSNGK